MFPLSPVSLRREDARPSPPLPRRSGRHHPRPRTKRTQGRSDYPLPCVLSLLTLPSRIRPYRSCLTATRTSGEQRSSPRAVRGFSLGSRSLEQQRSWLELTSTLPHPRLVRNAFRTSPCYTITPSYYCYTTYVSSHALTSDDSRPSPCSGTPSRSSFVVTALGRAGKGADCRSVPLPRRTGARKHVNLRAGPERR